LRAQNVIVLFALVLGGIYWLSERPQPEILSASQIYVIDGDTIDVDGQRYRLTGFDTPETYRAECESEKLRGDQATARMRALVGATVFRRTAILLVLKGSVPKKSPRKANERCLGREDTARL